MREAYNKHITAPDIEEEKVVVRISSAKILQEERLTKLTKYFVNKRFEYVENCDNSMHLINEEGIFAQISSSGSHTREKATFHYENLSPTALRRDRSNHVEVELPKRVYTASVSLFAANSKKSLVDALAQEIENLLMFYKDERVASKLF